MSERPTPHPSGAWSRSDYAKAYDDLERQLADAMAQLRIADEQLALERVALDEARAEIGRIRYFATVNGVAELERQLAEARRERDNALSDWRQADSDTVRALHERNEAREQRDALAKECEWMRALIETIRDKADLRFNGNRGLCAFSDLKDAARAAVKESTPEQP